MDVPASTTFSKFMCENMAVDSQHSPPCHVVEAKKILGSLHLDLSDGVLYASKMSIIVLNDDVEFLETYVFKH